MCSTVEVSRCPSATQQKLHAPYEVKLIKWPGRRVPGAPHFFLPPAAASALCSQVTILPNITTPLPSMKATRERPSQFLNVSHTNGCWGWNAHSAISLGFKEWGSSIFLPPVSFPPC